MANISLLEMARTKKRGVREAIIEILSREFPLSVKKIYNKVKKEYNLGITYQAVFKTIKEMLSEKILKEENKEYLININWLNELHEEIKRVEENYFKASGKEIPKTEDSINKFVDKVGPEIKEYLGNEEGCIIGVTGLGTHYALPLWKYLVREGKKANFVELNKVSLIKGEKIKLNKVDFENRKVIIIDYAILGGNMYRLITNKFDSLRRKFKIKETKYAVYKDTKGLADFSVKEG